MVSKPLATTPKKRDALRTTTNEHVKGAVAAYLSPIGKEFLMTDVRERVRRSEPPAKPTSRDPYRTDTPKSRGAGFAPLVFIVLLVGAVAYYFYTQSATVNGAVEAPVEQTF
jgi:hypothetical protein